MTPSFATPPGPEPSQWHRLHPLTPYLRSWAVVVAVVAGVVANLSSITGTVEDVLGDDRAAPAAIGWSVLGGLAALALYTSWAVLSWRMTRYRLDDDALEYEVGVVFRQHRQARLDRLQAVDVVRPLIARLLGLSELRLEVAGGSGSDVRLQYLRVDDTHRLREAVLARAAAAEPAAGAGTPTVVGSPPAAPPDGLATAP